MTSSEPGMMLFAPVPAWMSRIWKLVGEKYSLPRSHSAAASSVKAGSAACTEIAPAFGIGDVALNAVDPQHAIQRSAAAVLDRVAQALDRRRLADDACVDAVPARLQFADDGSGAVDSCPFLVRGEEAPAIRDDLAPGPRSAPRP